MAHAETQINKEKETDRRIASETETEERRESKREQEREKDKGSKRDRYIRDSLDFVRNV